ncbi:Leucine-rich repeat protein kinase family protein [Perilla frutescens var. hirtella]|uniref:Leucine-rich repeat protein kinase family protein n=1 Tax=Perilla frutescens var. hirtella TaxID=608512 RepID=A0AAD4P0H0_PERFH|nr:Leucine-rich repeat protein kinase family protein [Perilla frutescens var. hirtella]
MQIKELEKIETSGAKNQENTVRLEKLEASADNCVAKGSNFNSIIDVSGKVLDFPLFRGEESTAEEVYMYKNELNLIPRDVGRLKGLKTLKFFANELNLFPEEFRNLVELECLQVKVTEPGVSGLELSKLENLKELELSRVPPRPSAFPILREIAGLKRLTRLSICHFSIRYLPPEIGCLSNLEDLDLSFNKMRNLPDEITLLNLLISLKVTNNKLVELPGGFSNLQRLESLDLSNNRLTSIECLELESMHNLQSLNVQHNQLSDCRVPSWICCNLEDNGVDLDESAEMDVYEGSPVVQSSHLSGLSPNHRSLAARRAKGWKRRYNLQTKARQERLNNCRKWKGDVTSRSSLEKCTTCKVVEHHDDTLSEGLSAIVDAELDHKDLFPAGKVNESVTSRVNEVITDKRSMDGCSCSETDSVSSQSNAVLSSVSDAVEVHDEGSSSEVSNCVPKCKRHSEKDLDNPKPSKYRKPTSDPYFLSCQYSRISFCGAEDHLPDGFYDAGRDRPFMPLPSYEKNTQVHSREVILLDRERDEELDAILLCARALVRRFRQMNSSINERRDLATEILQTASLLALFVSDHFGGSDKSAIVQRARKAASGANCGEPFVCTCATGISSDTNKANKQKADNVDETVFLDICEKSLHSIKERRNSIIVPIGGLQFGVCRHRALLMKYLCDHMEPRIPCELVRGYLDFSPHAWNVVIMKEGESLVRMIVDACHPHDIRKESDPEYFCRYLPLSQVNAVVGHDTSSKCPFPSFSVCDEIGKLTSTSLMRCNIGALEAAVKVRTIDLCGASADKVRNFELSCLGEVRMLSVLKHSCIVELYGHQISSKWSMTADGNCGGRTLQSAILMEDIKGGSLKSYVEKLSSNGEKHVGLDLALSIARDVAFALTEIHAKTIIHRDIKSENILIDLDKKRQDGTPIVKICDFDRAIPLHSYLHTCCIAHLGIPPPNVCVGTPRWMAPEVYGAMNKQSMYGLEVDIWSFGCLLLELLTLEVPYYGLPETEIHNLLQGGERPKLTDELEALAQSDEELERQSETLRFLTKLFHQCTEKNPSDRPSAKKIYDLLLARASSVADSKSSEKE